MTVATVRAYTPRRTEMWLVVYVAALISGAYILASLGADSALPPRLLTILAAFLALNVTAHLAVRRFAPYAHPALLPTALILNGLGYVMISRLNPKFAALQATWTTIAIVALIVVLALLSRARDLIRYQYTIGLLGVALLILPVIPGIGRTVNGARLWIRVGAFTFQPGEIAKVLLAIFVASYLDNKRELLSHATKRIGKLAIVDARHFGPLILMIALSLGTLLIQKDLGSSVLLASMFVITLWIATGRAVYLAGGAALAMTGLFVANKYLPYVNSRVSSWLDPFASSQTGGYQLVQASYSFGSGGPYGTGLALGTPWRVPYAYNDFIFSAIGEELGLAGTTAIVIAFILFCACGFSVALHTSDSFEKLLAAALSTIIGVQSLIIMCGVVRLMPLTGIALPWVAYGGSSLVTNYIIVAILIRISNDAAQRRMRMKSHE